MTAPILSFGRHKGLPLNHVPESYVRWLANGAPSSRTRNRKPIDPGLQAAAQAIITALDAQKLVGEQAALLMSGVTREGDTQFVIEREGDITGMTIHASLDLALAQLCVEYPIETAPRWDNDQAMTTARSTPCPEDDRILIWEVLPSGHRKVVWQFAGWHFNSSEYACDQGTLPGDDEPLYILACRD